MIKRMVKAWFIHKCIQKRKKDAKEWVTFVSLFHSFLIHFTFELNLVPYLYSLAAWCLRFHKYGFRVTKLAHLTDTTFEFSV